MTINEIAKLAGVSPSTVSKIMNNKDSSISTETREHVLRIAKEYHYKPYASVITSSTSKSLCIGVIFRNASEASSSIEGILSAARAEGYSVLFYESNLSAEQELKNVSAMLDLNIDGIILEPVSSDFKSAEEQIKRAGIPYILVNSNTKESFQIDFEQMGYQTTQTLINARHTDIACLIRPDDRSAKFLQGYRQCLFDNGIPFNDDLIFNENEELPIKKISSHVFTGIIVSHYTLAIRLFKDITALHYSIPYDLTMITLKDGYSSYENGLPISTFTIPHMQFSQYITKTLLQIVEKKAGNSAFNFTAELDNSLSIDIPYHLRLKRIISLGSINIDNYMNFKELPHTGKTVTTSTSVIHPGGKCINEAIGAARLGHTVAAIGRVGDDADADLLYEFIQTYQIETSCIRRSKNCRTGQAYIFVQEDGNSMISILSGANNIVTAEDIVASKHIFSSASYCMIQTEVPMDAVLKAAELAKEYHVTTVLKPSACSYLPDELYSHIDLLVPNLDELNEICPGSQSMEEKADILLTKGIKTVIVTLGADGCYIRNADTACYLPAIDVVSTDSSGAGDAFICTLVSYLLYDYDLISASKIASYAAGLSTTRQGTTTALVDKYTLESYIRKSEPDLLK